MKKVIFLALSIGLAGCSENSGGVSSSGGICSEGCMSMVKSHLAKSKARVAGGPGLGYCRINARGIGSSHPGPEITVDTRNTGMTRPTQTMGAFLNVNASRYFFNGDPDAGRRAIRGLTAWSNANAHSNFVSQFTGSAEYWPSYALLAASLNAMFLLDDHPDMTPERKAQILSWAKRLMDRTKITSQLSASEAGHQGREQKINNHNARRALVLLYYGIHTEDTGLIRKSMRDVERSYGAIDSNGVPTDANRGDWALNYINLGLDGMMLHASHMSIIDPTYPSRRSDLRSSLNKGMAFLFREVRSPNQVHSYASKNIGRPQASYSGHQDIWFTRTDLPEGVSWAWVDSSFARLLPDGQREMRTTMARNSNLRRAKFIDTGGNVTCWFAG